ncbi:MAG: hypothetical protein ACI4O3_02875 [Oscillospiraceae bacterium]
MDTRSFEAGRGLRLAFWGELLFLAAIVCTLLNIMTSFFPLAAKVLAAVSFLLSLFGLVTAARAYQGYQSALVFLVISIILWAFINWVESGWPAAILNAASAAANYLMVARVCIASADLLFQRQDPDGVRQITKVRLRYLICSLVSIACFLIGSLPRFRVLSEIVWIMGAVVSLFANLIYLLFLRDIQELMRE